MSRKSSLDTYGSVAVTIHWLSALLIIALLVSGVVAENTSDPASKASLLSVHAPMGFLVLLLTLFRIVWWWRFDTKPKPLGSDPAWQEKTAKAVHLLLYVLIFVMVGSGIALFALSGAADVIFGGASGPLPNFDDFAPRVPHGLGADLMMILLLGHAGAALYHHFGKRDATLRRMWF